MNNLKQKQWPEFKNFTIEQNGLRLETRQEDQFINVLIDFEQIGSKEIIVNQKANSYGVIAFISVFINIIFGIVLIVDKIENSGILSGISGGLTVGFSLWARQLFKFSKQKVIQGQNSISFFYNKKEQVKVDNFIQELQSKKIKFLREKYMKVDRYTPTEQLKSRFIWLRENDYINESDLDTLMEKIEHRKLIDGE